MHNNIQTYIHISVQNYIYMSKYFTHSITGKKDSANEQSFIFVAKIAMLIN
jgi:hypothetical protein